MIKSLTHGLLGVRGDEMKTILLIGCSAPRNRANLFQSQLIVSMESMDWDQNPPAPR